jgi:tetratricopeptide (TPR) repeat protein
VAAPALTDTQNVPFLFQQRVLLNVRYWQRYVTDKQGDVAAQDRERERIVKAISFGLDQAEARAEAQTLLRGYSPHLERRGFWEDWDRLLNRAIDAAWRVNDTPAVIILTIKLAKLAQGQGNIKAAIRRYHQVIQLARQTGDRYQQARAYSNLGYLYTEQGNFWRAEALCCSALQIFEAFDDDHGRAHTENHLGVLYTRYGHWEKARLHLERACTIWQSREDHHGLMSGLMNLGLLHIEIRDADQSLIYLEKARQEARLSGAEVEMGRIFQNIGVSYRIKEELRPAEAHLRHAEQIFKKVSNLVELARVWNNLGLVYLDQGRWAKARQYLTASLDTRRKLNHFFGELYTLIHLIEYDLARGDRTQALLKLNYVEPLIVQRQHFGLYHQLETMLARYRHVLARAA